MQTDITEVVAERDGMTNPLAVDNGTGFTTLLPSGT
jgi:hypothetical protein